MSMRFWIRKPFTRPKTRTIRKATHRARLAVELLEDRVVPSTYSDVLSSGVLTIGQTGAGNDPTGPSGNGA